MKWAQTETTEYAAMQSSSNNYVNGSILFGIKPYEMHQPVVLHFD
jgi:hypothetical protein